LCSNLTKCDLDEAVIIHHEQRDTSVGNDKMG